LAGAKLYCLNVHTLRYFRQNKKNYQRDPCRIGSLHIYRSAISKFAANEEALKMASTFGLDLTANYTLGIVELAGVILFAIPRTGIIGTLLLAAYMGGAIATHLEHGLPVIAPCAIQAFIWIAAFVRFPELSNRILGRKLT
jgi:hypothetical protein